VRTLLTTHPVSRPLVTIALCLSVVLAPACNDNSGATPPPSPESTPPTTPTPTPSKPAPPTLPPTAKGLTIQSAEAFTRFYLQLIDYAELTGDVQLPQRWSDKGCIGCSEVLDDYNRIFDAGGSVSGDSGFKNVVTTRIRLNGTTAAEVTIRATIGRHTVIEKRGASPIVYPGEEVRWTVTLAAKNGQWITFEIEDEAG
jgi:hypothetical protein